jgi:hypothetical protein
LFLLGQIVGVKANRFCLDTCGHPATTMAKRLASSQSQLLYSSEASVADSVSEFELDVDASSSAGSEPVTATRRQQRSRVAALRYRSTLPEASEKALVSILLDPVLQRQKPEIVYKGQERLFGEPKSIDAGTSARANSARRSLPPLYPLLARQLLKATLLSNLILQSSRVTTPFHTQE